MLDALTAWARPRIIRSRQHLRSSGWRCMASGSRLPTTCSTQGWGWPARCLARRARRCWWADDNAHAIIALFDRLSADELAVVDEAGVIAGVVTERHVRGRHLHELDNAQRTLFGES